MHPPLALQGLAKFLAEGGEVVGGAAAFGATLAWIASGLLQDIGYASIDRRRWAELGANGVAWSA